MDEVGPEKWIEIDHSFAESVRYKQRLIAQNSTDVFSAQEQAYDASQELLQSLCDNLAQHHTNTFQCQDGFLFNRTTGQSWNIARSGLHPLDLAGRLVTEDFCLHLLRGDSYNLVAATLCSPSAWQLKDRMGLSLDALHVPVPNYHERLAAGVKAFFGRIEPNRFYCRVVPNWGLFTSPEPFQPKRLGPPELITAKNAYRALWLRTEKHVFHRLRATKAVVFTIRVTSTVLNDVIRNTTDAVALASTIRSMPEDTLSYKNITPYADALLAWLDNWTPRRSAR